MSEGRGSYRRRQRIKRALAAVQQECFFCLEPLDFGVDDPRDPRFVVIDEYVPVSKGGSFEDISNCNLACRACNARKGDEILPFGAFATDERRVLFGLPPLGGSGMFLHIPKPSRKWL